MAQKRLNKKVALVGSLAFAVFVVLLIFAILHFSRDPEKFIKDGDAAMKAANEATDEQTKTEEYKKAERNYREARSLVKSDSLRVKILFKLADIHLETDRWNYVMGCWDEIIKIDPKNAKARYGRLKYFYIMADSGVHGAWKEVASQASEFIEVAEENNLLMEDTAQLESFKIREKEGDGQCLGSYLYLLRGRATLEMTRGGAFTNPDESLDRAVNDLKKVQEFEPGNIDSYLCLAQAAVEKGELLASRGKLEEREKSAEQAKGYLNEVVERGGTDTRAHINLLRMKVIHAQTGGREQLQPLESEYLSLVEKFPSSAEAYSALARFYRQLGHKNLDKAIEAGEKALELDKENVVYAINAADLHYRKFSVYRQKPHLHKAMEVSKRALTFPDAQDKPGPREWRNRINRISLYVFLANCYIEQILEPCETATESQKQEWIANAEQAVHEIEQLFGSGENASVVEWQGMLELAKGNKNIAIRKLYATYEQLKAASVREEFERIDSLLSYRLAKIFEDTAELGAVNEFFATALRLRNRGAPDKIDERKPEALLDYADVSLKLRNYNGALNIADFFEKEYWANERSQTVRIKALLGTQQFKEAEEELAKRKPNDPNTIKLNVALMQAKIKQVQRAIAQKRAEEDVKTLLQESKVLEQKDVEPEKSLELMTTELRSYRDALGELVKKLLQTKPNSVGEASLIAVCNNYIVEEKTSVAKDLVNRFLEHFPDNTRVLFYKQMLSEPEPQKIPQERRKEIEEQVLSNIADPIQRAVHLGAFYQRYDELEKAAEEFKKVIEIETLQEGVVEEPAVAEREEITDSQRLAASYLFETALKTKDWELAKQIADFARRANLDNCEGEFFAARLAVTKEEYKDALARLEECLKQRPVFSAAYMLRSNVNVALGNEHAAIEDAQKAASLNPLNRAIARVLAGLLYQRNKKLGDNVVSSDQIIETRTALDRAIALNPNNLELLSFYAEYISETEPLKALAIRQNLQRAAPSTENAILLGRLATRVALRETSAKRKEALLAIASSSFADARAIEPENKTALTAQAEYYRLIGKPEEAEKLLAQPEDKELLWRHYFRTGQFEKARAVCKQLYQSESKNSDLVKGLLVIAERIADKEAAKKYSEELLSLEETIENYLLQIQTFLKIGLVKEAEHKLQSFKEKYRDEPRALLLEAWLAMRQGQLKRALDLANQTLAANEDNATAWRLKGETNLLMANYAQAISDLKRSKLLSDEPATRNSLAKAYLRSGRYEESIIELKNTIDHPQAPAEARALLERIYLKLGRKGALIRFYDETLDKLPDSVLWYTRAGAFAIEEGEFERAEQLYELAWQKANKDGNDDNDPKHNRRRLGIRATALDGYLEALVLGGKLDKVFEESREYVDGEFAPIAYLRMAEARLKLGDKTTAIEYCQKAVDKAGTNETFVSGALQRIYSLLGAEEALRCCEERLRANPDLPATNLAMFNFSKINGEYNKAVHYIDKYLQIIGPESPHRAVYTVKKAEVLSLAYNKTSDNNYLKRAITVYESVLAEMPKNTGVLNNLAYMLAQNNERLPEALKYAERAHKVRPNNPFFMDTYGYVLYKNGRFSEAEKFLQAAIQQYEEGKTSVPWEVYEHLGMIKEKVGAEAEALAAYKQALEMGADELSTATRDRITMAIEHLSQQDKK
jgi:tetratricopeptide (TPR) repeat protein